MWPSEAPSNQLFDEFLALCSERTVLEKLSSDTQHPARISLREIATLPIRFGLLGVPESEQVHWRTMLAEPTAIADPAIAKVLHEHRTSIELHPVYIWLKAQSDFGHAWATFQNKRKRNARAGYQHLLAEASFLAITAFHCTRYWDVSGKQGRHYPTKSELTKARNATTKLVTAFNRSVRLEDHRSTETLQRLLAELDREIGVALIGRKPRDDASTPEREFIRLLGLNLIGQFGEASPEIVCDLAQMVGIERDKSTIEKQLKKLRDIWRHSLAKALREHRTKS